MTKGRLILAVLAGALGLGVFASANAVPVTIHYTVDNSVVNGGTCDTADCYPLLGVSDFDLVFADGTEPNASDWRNADTVVIDLAPGTYGIAFVADNFGTGSSGNPAGFLADIQWQGMTNVTSSAWDVTIDGVNWVSATEWAQNGTGIWGGNLLGEIASDAYWLWTANNFDATTNVRAGFRTTITVPEPSILGLFGLGLLGLGFASRRRAG